MGKKDTSLKLHLFYNQNDSECLAQSLEILQFHREKNDGRINLSRVNVTKRLYLRISSTCIGFLLVVCDSCANLAMLFLFDNN